MKLKLTNALRNKMAKIGAIAAIAIAGISLYNPIYNAYQKHTASNLIESARKLKSELEDSLNNAENTLRNTSYLFSTPQTEDDYLTKLSEVKQRLKLFNDQITDNETTFSHRNYSLVKSNLSPTFGMPKGQIRTTVQDVVSQEKAVIDTVVGYCVDLGSSRNAVLGNELLLKATLKKPYDPQKPLPQDLNSIPANFKAIVPQLTVQLEEALRYYSPSLSNSLGANLFAHESTLSHIMENAKREQIKKDALGLFESARISFEQVKPLNDKLLWYCTNMDGTIGLEDYHKTLSEQKQVISHLNAGNNSLYSLNELNKRLHEQWIIEVTGNSSHNETYYDFFDDDDHWKKKTIYTYTLTTTTPSGQTSKEINSGEVKGISRWFGYNYPMGEKAGHVIEWKPLHDNKVYSGHRTQLNPTIERE